MTDPAAPAGPGPGQLALFRARSGPRVTIDYARPDGGPLTDEDFDLLARLTRTATTRYSPTETDVRSTT